MQTSDQPFAILDLSATTGWLYSYYLQDEWRPAPKLTFNFGGRFDQMAEYVNGRQLSPRASLVWQPTDATTFTLGYARYFVPPPFELIAPTTISLFANTSAAPTVTQDDRAKPERDHYFDASATQVILPGLKTGRRRLLQDRQRSDRRGPVRRADHPDPVQLSKGSRRRRRTDD